MSRIGFLFEHPDWSRQLLNVFRGNGIDLELVDMSSLEFDTGSPSPSFAAAVNRVNIMPSAGQGGSLVAQTIHYLNWLELCGVRVINGARSHMIGASKVMQNGIFASLGLRHPGGIAVFHRSQVMEAAERIGYPLIVKPNIGGSGSGIELFENSHDLEKSVKFKLLDLGLDGTGLVQRVVPSDGFVYRVEVLGNQLFYSIRQPIQSGSFNYCAADGCSTTGAEMSDSSEFDFCAVDAGNRIEAFECNPGVVDNVVEIINRCGADLGGVEYLLDPTDGVPCFYDFNPYSNFVTDGQSLLGFSPEQRFVDFVVQALQTSVDLTASGMEESVRP